MSRNKENNPLFTARRHGPSASLGTHLSSEDFFTDSILEDSRIPSPSPQKPSPARARRAIGSGRVLQSTRDLGNKSKRSSLAEYTASRSTRRLQPVPALTRKKSPSPRRTNDPSTPPQSRDGPSLTSPTSEFSSPPGGMTDVYRRIADEEDLAATEREVDTDEDQLEDNGDDTLELDVDASAHATNEAAERETPSHKRTSRESTPVQSPTTDAAGKEAMVDDRVEVYSEPATLDFVQNEMTDRVLAAKLTPHVVDRAKDRARLERLRQNRIPIDFKHSPKPGGNTPNGHGRHDDIASVANRGPIIFNNTIAVPKAYSDTSAESTPHKRIKAFSRATRAGAHKKAPSHDDGSDTPPELRQRERVVAFSKATRRKNKPDTEPEPESPEVAPAPRLVAFSRANGRSRPYGAPYETNGNELGTTDQSTGSVTSALSEPLPEHKASSEPNLQAARSYLAKWRQDTAEKRAVKKHEPVDDNDSHIDWAAAAADVPLPSVEESSTPRETHRETPPRDEWLSSIQKQSPADRMRRWENDFTGLSFQISESPPVRSRLNPIDSPRGKEIEDLEKQAVTTNRLDEIRVKDPSVRVRKSSSSLSLQDRRQANPEALDAPGVDRATNSQEERVGDRIPDTPVVVYRQSSSSTEKSKSSQRSAAGSHSSLEHLQRLARAASTTPKSSPPARGPVSETQLDSETGPVVSLSGSQAGPREQSPPAEKVGIKPSTVSKVAATPKIVGGWTDTILPDTIKTGKQTHKASRYMETPHVNAGAWIDTPLANGNGLYSAPFPNTIEEVTEELTNDIAAAVDSADEDSLPGEETKEVQQKELDAQPAANGAMVIPPSALTNVLNEAKQKRLVSRDITDVRDDTLNLGDATIQSFEDLLSDAADITADLTNLIKTGAEEEFMKQRELEHEALGDSTTAEVAFIGHLTSRMERLMSNLHEARKGISRLEQRVSHSPSPPSNPQVGQLEALIASQDPDQPCAVCGCNQGVELHKHTIEYDYSKSLFPMSYSTFTVPIPLLFYPRRKDRGQLLPRPTWLGWLTIAIWTWYISECTLCEIYCHPQYAERYIWPAHPEPEFPFVLPTMLWRWVHLDAFAPGLFVPVTGVLGTFWRLVVAVYRVVGMSLGLIDGFVDDTRPNSTPSAVAEATRSVLNVAKSFVPTSGGPDLRMMNDEFI
ncbi:hypothetical protein A1O3_06789 [Capronia epimyces CBS 606.96]|uniref:Uncharacterized protein n=1 Tax=Capronia epimyces CBS 606.96 TaxID=1182542 RepID=W9XR07_9EURO|nr:uncharacterized protein A1O3_06789 [Capronia epimyces CBS 606.96]EXJ82972.1 hypothetical protein A1O3_06789 [Capronia epimyces CBS 606.96]